MNYPLIVKAALCQKCFGLRDFRRQPKRKDVSKNAMPLYKCKKCGLLGYLLLSPTQYNKEV